MGDKTSEKDKKMRNNIMKNNRINDNSITEEFRKVVADGTKQLKVNSTSDYIQNEKENNMLGKAFKDLSQESLVQGLIFSEIFGQPKCKRRGW